MTSKSPFEINWSLKIPTRIGWNKYYCNDQKNSRFIFVSENISTISNFFHLFSKYIYYIWDYWDVIVSKSSSVPRYISQLHFFFLRLRLCSHWLNSLAHRLTTTVIILWLGIWTLLPIWWCQCRIRGCQIGVQGPHLCAKPRHFT